MGRIYPAKKHGIASPLDLGATYWHSPINSDYIIRDKTDFTPYGGSTTDSVAFLANRGTGSSYDLTEGDKNLQPDYAATALNGTPGIHFATAASDPNYLPFAAGRDFINNVPGLTVGYVFSLPTFTGSQRLMRFTNAANTLSRIEILAITNNRIQIGGTRQNTDTLTSTASANNAYTPNTPFVLIAQWDFTGNALRAWINGTQVINNTSWLNGTGAGTNTVAENASLGVYGSITSYQADWYGGEDFGFKSAISALSVGQLTTYLKKGALIS